MKKHVFPILALSAAVFFLTLPTLHYGYLLEDYKYIRYYSLTEILHGFYSHWEPTLSETKGYRPFHAVHFAFFHWLIGDDPGQKSYPENHPYHGRSISYLPFRLALQRQPIRRFLDCPGL